MEGDNSVVGNHEKEENGSSTHSSPQEHKSFAEFAKDKLDSGKNFIYFELLLYYCFIGLTV